MRRIFAVFVILLCLSLLTVPCAASSAVSSADTSVTVERDGTSRVSIHYQIWLEEEGKIQLWLPAGAEEIRVDGHYRTPEADGQRLRITLSNMGSGMHTVDVNFRLRSTLKASGGGKLTLHLPLLPGMAYPTESFQFFINLPGETDAKPSFSSGYYGQGIETQMTFTTVGNRITGMATGPLLDRETLDVELVVDKALFPEYEEKTNFLVSWQTVMLLVMAVSIAYYVIALLPIIPRKIRATEAPDGLAAGELGSCLTGCGMDLTMMVFSWAQKGYLRICAEPDGRVLLRKQMDMGNERPEREVYYFNTLFAQRNMVDGAGLHYARLCRRMAMATPLARTLYKTNSGNPRIVRILAVLAGMLCGVELSTAVYTSGVGGVFLAMLLAIVCGSFSALIQVGSRFLTMGDKKPLWMSLLSAALFALVGLLCGNVTLAAAVAVYELVMGLLSAIGGRRSALGQQYVAQIRGLRTYLTRVSVFNMQQALQNNPDYFFDRMPEALALGVEKRFARRCGKGRIPACGYLELPDEQERTPAQWAALLRRMVDSLNRRQQRLLVEKLLERWTGNHRERY